MAVVAWDEIAFREVYPNFSHLSAVQLRELWFTACTLIDNTDSSSVPYDPSNGLYVREIVLRFVMCHLATMAGWTTDGQAGPATSVSEGSVSASFQLPQAPSGSMMAEYYNQTPCGRSAMNILRRFGLGGKYYGATYYHPYG